MQTPQRIAGADRYDFGYISRRDHPKAEAAALQLSSKRLQDRVLAGSLNLRIFELKKFDCLKIVPPLSILARLQALYQYRLHCGYNHVDV